MKKLIITSVMTLFLSGMVAQATSTISWDFDTIGDTEGWCPVSDTLNSLTNGVLVTSGYDSVVLTTPDVTGNDAGININTNLTIATGEFWDTLEIRSRTLDGNFGTPVAYNGGGTLGLIYTGQYMNTGTVGGEGWANSLEAGEWLVSSYDISELGTNNIYYLRIDVPSGGDIGSFEYDYIRIHTSTNPPSPVVYKTAWEFNTPSDTEGWDGCDVTNVHIATARGGTESVLTTSSAGEHDPQVVNYTETAHLKPGLFWSTVELRIRQLTGSTPEEWDSSQTLFLLNDRILSLSIGSTGWDTTVESDGWIVTRFDISFISGDISSMRVDPFAVSAGRNFEIDYVRFETRTTPPLPSAPLIRVKSWEFNTVGDTEDFTIGQHMTGLTSTTAITGTEGVLTSDDITDIDPVVFYNEIVDPSLVITPPKPWTTIEMRVRQLDGNPGDLGVSSKGFDASQLLCLINPWTIFPLPWEVVYESDNWTILTYNISGLESSSLDGLRVDPVAETNSNFEIDYIRIFAKGGKYDAWSQVVYGLNGTDAEMVADPDGDTFNNLYEFAFDGDPTNALNIGYIESEVLDDGGTIYFEYRYARRIDINNGLEYALEQNRDLSTGAWVDLGAAAEVGTLKINDDYEVVTNRIVIAADTNIYVRVSAKLDNNVVYSEIIEVTEFDGWVVSYGLSGADAEPTADPDIDGLSNQEEFKQGTNPTADDSDGDLLSDFEEVNNIIAWGDNSYGQTLVPSNAVNIIDVTAGETHSLALLAEGIVVAWGDNEYHQCNVPSSISNIVSIAAGGSHSLASLSNGTVIAWGSDAYQQSTVPSFATNVVAVSAGVEHSMALQETGHIVVWGNNYHGVRDVPPSVTNVIQIAAGGYHNLALLADGTVIAWGDNANGACNIPSQVTNAVAVAAGGYHSMAILSDGRLVAWGKDDHGQSVIPSTVSNTVTIALGGYHNLAILADESIETWGNSSYDLAPIPPRVQYPIAISAGRFFSLALIKPTDPLDPDSDNDGLNDGVEVNTFGTDPLNADSDYDGLSDGQEVLAGLDPLTSNIGLDGDSDGLLDIDEVNLYHTDPLDSDSDTDGVEDGEEINTHGTDPLNPDSDGDTFGDGEEIMHGGLPLISDFWHVEKIRNNGSTYDLYPSNSVLDLAVGEAGFEVVDGEAWLLLQLEESMDLTIWTNVGNEVIWSIPVDQSNAFYRVRSGH